MFATVAGSYLWAWTAVGAALELLFQIIPVALGWRDTIDAGLARVLFSWTLHAIVYFWLIPSLYRLLHDRPTGDRRAAVQRHDGTDFVRAVPCRRDADRSPPRVRGPAGRRRVQISAFGVHRARHGAHPADRVHDLRIGRDRRAAARRERGARLAQGVALAQPGDARR